MVTIHISKELLVGGLFVAIIGCFLKVTILAWCTRKAYKKMYYDNIDTIIELQDKIVKRGNEQTPLNYWLQINNVDVNIDLPIAFKLTHLQRKDMFNHNWQLDEDKTPFFIKYGYNFSFNGLPKDQRNNLMKQTWDMIKDNYK